MSVPIAASGARVLSTLPPEISALIAEHVDRKSAINLMLASRGLKDAGECAVYSRLDLTGSWNPEQKQDLISDDIPRYRARASIVDAKLASVHAALERHPYRLQYVKEVRLEPSDGGAGAQGRVRAASLVKLLGLIAPHIQRLDILPLRSWDHWSKNDRAKLGSIDFFTRLNHARLAFPRLHLLRFAHPGGPIIAVDRWMSWMSNLRHLEYHSALASFPDHVLRFTTPPPFLHLRTISFNNLYDVEGERGRDVLRALLGLAPNLQILRLRGQWAPSVNDAALQALGQLRRLRCMITVDEDFEPQEKMCGIHFQKLGKVRLDIEEAAVAVPDLAEHVEQHIEGLPYPNGPCLRRITILTPPRPPLSDYISLGIGLTPHRTQRTTPFLQHVLRRVPKLDTLLYQHCPDAFPVPDHRNDQPPELFVDPERWESEGFRGAVIRQYRRPGRPHLDTDDEEFWHVRMLLRATRNELGEVYVGPRRVWTDHTHFKGRTVPRSVLEAVYREMGEAVEFLEGGRDMGMGEGEESDKAWAALNQWRDGAGDESDEEDCCPLDGTEDDDLLSDQGF